MDVTNNGRYKREFPFSKGRTSPPLTHLTTYHVHP